MNIIPEIAAMAGELEKIRRHLHANPELSFDVQQTAALVAKKLSQWGFEVAEAVGRTGVVGTIRQGSSSRAIGLRADMDALPIIEQNRFAHQSIIHGKMHACGHDGHTVMLLGAAQYLATTRQFDGIVRVIFQPAEEAGGGAKAMIEDGLFDRFPVDAVFALHNWPGMPAGHFGVCKGPIMASTNSFKVTLIGAGSHGAMPHLGKDPLFAAVQIYNGLQGIITRQKAPLEAAVLSVTQLQSGSATNINSETAFMAGTIRTFSEDTTTLIENKLRQIVGANAAAYDCKAEIEFKRSCPATINDDEKTELGRAVMTDLVGEDRVTYPVVATTGAEDFSFMLNEIPGCYAFIGNGMDGLHRTVGHGVGPCYLHNASYDFNDQITPVGASYLAKVVERFLAPNGRAI